MEKSGLARGRRVADLCTGTGVVAIAAAEQGASQVTAFDMCPRPSGARGNARCAGVDVDVHLGSWARATEFGPFDLVVCNPPYVPHDPDVDDTTVPAIGPARAWNAGHDGRLMLDPLCAACPSLLADGGTILSCTRSSPGRASARGTGRAGIDAEIVAYQWIPFGPVLTARAQWLEDTGRLEPGRREEELVVIRADRP